MARLQKIYRDEIVAKLMTSLAVTNPMQVPKITKISVNMGVGEAVADKKAMDGAVNDLTALTGQKPVVTKSRKAIAAFKLRAGVPVGGNRLRPGRRDPRDGHHDHDDGTRRPGRPGVARILQLPVPQVGQETWRRPA